MARIRFGVRKEPRDGGASTPQLIRNVFGDGAALVHVAGDPLLIRRHARSGRPKNANRHNAETVPANSTKQNVQQDATKNKTPTVDGIKFATSMKRQTTTPHDKPNANKEMGRTPVPPEVQCWHVREGVGVA